MADDEDHSLEWAALRSILGPPDRIRRHPNWHYDWDVANPEADEFDSVIGLIMVFYEDQWWWKNHSARKTQFVAVPFDDLLKVARKYQKTRLPNTRE